MKGKEQKNKYEKIIGELKEKIEVESLKNEIIK